MRFAYQQSFLDATSHLSEAQAARLLKATERFQHAMEHHQWPLGLSVAHLRKEYFEFHLDIHMRVFYRRTSDLIQYVLYGNHDDVRRFLKTL